MSLVVGAGTHDDPSEHGVTAIPDFGLDGRSPSPLGELGVFLTPVLYGIVEDLASDGSGGPLDFKRETKETLIRAMNIKDYLSISYRLSPSNDALLLNSNKLTNSYLDTAEVAGAKAETEVAARVRAARVRRGAMVEVYEEIW